MHGQQLRVRCHAHLLGLHHGDRLDAASDDDIHAVDDDLFGGGGDGHQAGGALAVHRHAGDGHGQAGAQGGGAADRVLDALLQGRAVDDVLHLGRIDLGAFDGCGDGVTGQRR